MFAAFTRIQLAALVVLILVPLNYVRGVVKRGGIDAPIVKTEAQHLEGAQASALAAADLSIESSRQLFEALAPAAEETVSLTLYAPNFRRYENFELTTHGELVGRSEKDLRSFFKCRRSGRRHRMSPRVLSMLADLGKKYEGRVIEIVSGYRRRGYGAPRSKHFIGNAIDLRIRGVELSEIRDYLWNKYDDLGLGHYHKQDFIHMDFRPSRNKIGWLQRRANSDNRYNPWWTKKGAVDPAEIRRAKRAERAARRAQRKAKKSRRRNKRRKKNRGSDDYYTLMHD